MCTYAKPSAVVRGGPLPYADALVRDVLLRLQEPHAVPHVQLLALLRESTLPPSCVSKTAVKFNAPSGRLYLMSNYSRSMTGANR